MVRHSKARHARPRGRGALLASYDLLRAQAADAAAARFADQLDVVRLSVLIATLGGHLEQLVSELAAVRRELDWARTSPARTDRHIDGLLHQVADLRMTVDAQASGLAALTSQLTLLSARALEASPVSRVDDGPRSDPPVAPESPRQPLSIDASGLASDFVSDDEVVMRLRLIRQSFDR